MQGNDLTWITAEEVDGSIREVDWVGTGCVYLTRRILERMADLRGDEVFQPEHGMEWAGRGEDQEFCRSAKAVGFKLHYHTGVQVGHLGLTNVNQEFVGRIEQGVEPPKVDCMTESRAASEARLRG